VTIRVINVVTGVEDDREYTQEELDTIASAPQPTLTKEQQRRAILDSLGCFNLTHMQKDWALLESERERLVQSPEQAYAANVTYRAFVDAQAALADIEAQP